MVNPVFSAMLREAGIPDADFEICCMLEQITGQKYVSELTQEQSGQISDMIQRRINGEPLQYILGEWEFYGMKLFVGEGVLIPRPDTELLVDTVLAWCKGRKINHIIDLCTGSGCIALALKQHLPDVRISAVEYSSRALAYARKNADYHHLAIDFCQADVLDAITSTLFPPADVIVSNPPYLTCAEMADLQTEVRHEPCSALAAGEDGLRYYRNITELWKQTLVPGGLLAFEIGWQQAVSVTNILQSHDFSSIHVIQDLEHRDRNVTGEKNF